MLNLNSPQKEDWPWLPAWTCWMVVPAMDIAFLAFHFMMRYSMMVSTHPSCKWLKKGSTTWAYPTRTPINSSNYPETTFVVKATLPKKTWRSCNSCILIYLYPNHNLYLSYTIPQLSRSSICLGVYPLIIYITVCYGFHSKLRVRSTNKWVRFHHSCRNYMINHYWPLLTIINHHWPLLAMINH